MKKPLILLTVCFLLCSLALSGCKEIQVFETKGKLEFKEVSDKEIKEDTYYVKNGTKFAPVYKPNGTADVISKQLRQNRVLYFYGDEFMIPIHYKNELVAYASQKANLSSVHLERFEDMGYSLGIYGGSIKEDGFYHINAKNNLVPDSDAETLFANTKSDSIRIVSVNDIPISECVDTGSGIITGLTQGESYIVEFYAGTYFYRSYFKADIHFMRPFEVYSFDSQFISDTTHGYMCFNTPDYLKSGYYFINGSGLFLYHSYEKGEAVEGENLNEPYYESTNQVIESYSQQYTIDLEQPTKDLKIEIIYGNILNEEDENEEIGAFVEAPDGTGYKMEVNSAKRSMTLTLSVAMAGRWVINISPKSLEIESIDVTKQDIYEETSLIEQEFVIEEDMEYQMFMAEISGEKDTENIRGTIIGNDNVTYLMNFMNDEDNKEKSFLYYKVPYLKKGTYKVKIYFYHSKNEVGNIRIVPYNQKDSDIFILKESTNERSEEIMEPTETLD